MMSRKAFDDGEEFILMMARKAFDNNAINRMIRCHDITMSRYHNITKGNNDYYRRVQRKPQDGIQRQ